MLWVVLGVPKEELQIVFDPMWYAFVLEVVRLESVLKCTMATKSMLFTF